MVADSLKSATGTSVGVTANSGKSWRIAFITFCAVGVVLCAYLMWLHVKVHTDPGYVSACVVSAYVNCEDVALSEYAVFGGLPVALWGLIGYLFMGGLGIRGLRWNAESSFWPYGILFGLSMFSVGVSGVYFYISHFLIHALCIVCMATFAVNVILCGASVGAVRAYKINPFAALCQAIGRLGNKNLSAYASLFAFVALVGLIWLTLPAYWLSRVESGPDGLNVGITVHGRHWIGARNPTVEITVFSDYQCPSCQRSNKVMRKLLKAHSDQIRLVHRHYPLRHHRYSFGYAVLANCAGRQDRFWEASDYLYANGSRSEPVTAEELARTLHLDADALNDCFIGKEERRAVVDDIEAGNSIKVRATPTFVIGNNNYTSRIPPEVIDSMLEQRDDRQK